MPRWAVPGFESLAPYGNGLRWLLDVYAMPLGHAWRKDVQGVSVARSLHKSRGRALDFSFIPTGQLVPLRALGWACAQALALARSQSNRGRRSSHDRGPEQNLRGDLVGAAAELLVLSYAIRRGHHEAAHYMRSHMYDYRGGQGVVDLPGVDIKAHGCEPHKRYIANNERTHQGRRGVRWYVWVLCPVYAKHALVSDLVPHTEAGHWPVFSLGHHGDPSHNIHVSEFLARYCSVTNLAAVRGRYSEVDIRRLRDEAHRALSHLLPSIMQAGSR